MNHEAACFEHLPNEMVFEIFQYLHKNAFLTVRRVSKKWKCIADGSRRLAFTCVLTDETLKTVVNSDEHLSCILVQDFQGNDNKAVSSTRGAGRVFGNAEAIHLRGRNINAVELIKLMRYAVNSLKQLQFQKCESALTRSVLEFDKRPFKSLTSLTLRFNTYPNIKDETRILQSLDSRKMVLHFPSLQDFSIIYKLARRKAYDPLPSGIQHFENYLAVARLILRFKGTLKTVKIRRNDRLLNILDIDWELNNIQLSPLQTDQLQECLREFNQVQLDVLEIDAMIDEGNFPWILERRLTLEQQSLKHLVARNMYNVQTGPPTESLTNIFPAHYHLLTSIEMAVMCSASPAPLNLGIFSSCPGLKQLWLWVYIEDLPVPMLPNLWNIVRFTNLEQLPTGITSLHLKPSSTLPIIHFLSLEHIQWITQNLKDLESIEIQLITSDDQNAVVGDDEEGGNNQNENINVNINVDTFRNLISMRKIRELRLDMIKLSPWIVRWVNALANPSLLIRTSQPQDFQEYVDICNEFENKFVLKPRGNWINNFPARIMRITMN